MPRTAARAAVPPNRPAANEAQLPQEDRAAPHSLEAEQSVLGGLLIDRQAWDRAADQITEGDFYRWEHREIFKAIGALIQAGQPVDVITVFEQLQGQGQAEQAGGLAYLNNLAQSVPSAANMGRYAEIVRERALLRQALAAADRLRSAVTDGGSPGEILAAAMRELGEIEGKTANTDGVPLLPLSELRKRSALTAWLVKHTVPQVSIGAIFGASQTFKSFIALDMALHIAHGMRWMGRRTSQAPVIYLAAEGGAGLWRRVEAWHRARSLSWDGVPFYVIPTPVELGTEAWRVVRSARSVGVTPGLVVVDTLSQTYSGDENAADQMAAFLRALGQEFRDLWQCSVLLVHHSGHSATERPRGSSAIGANLDFLLGTHRDERELMATLSCQKLKDCELFADASFSLKRVELGTDEDGDPVTSLVAWHLSTDDEIAQATQDEHAAGRSGHSQTLLSLVQNGMAEKGLRRGFYEQLGDAPTDTKKKAYYRARDRAISLHLIEIAEGIVIDLRRGL